MNDSDTSTTGLSREAFLQRVRDGLRGSDPSRNSSSHEGESNTISSASPVPPAVPLELLRTKPPAAINHPVGSNHESLSLREIFTLKAREIGMVVHHTSRASVMPDLLNLVDTLKLARVALGVDRIPELNGIGETLQQHGVMVLDWRSTPDLDAMFDVDAGITDVHAAIAETGSLVCASDATHSRGLSLVPPVHVALVRESDLLADLMDYLKLFGDEGAQTLPSSTVLITGPSKTADIEGVLVTGVHGPGQVHVLLVEDC